jgi:hypothetical protein
MHLTIYVIFPINFEKRKIGQDRTVQKMYLIRGVSFSQYIKIGQDLTVHPNEDLTLKNLLLCAFTTLTVSPDANVFEF